MPSRLTAYRIFIASPGGLDDERHKFREVVNRYNELHAIRSGVLFVPVAWDQTLGGVGRPQEMINKDLMQCDYFILILSDRWGSKPAKAGKYTSGTEEEYSIARDLYADPDVPMRQLILFFKTVDAAKLASPDSQLKKVLKFKRKLEREKALLFYDYGDLKLYENRLERHLVDWIKAHEGGIPPKPKGSGKTGSSAGNTGAMRSTQA